MQARGALAMAAVIAIAAFNTTAGDPPVKADMLGYGKITFTQEVSPDGQGVAVFACEDDHHADMLLSKLRADFTWDKLAGVKEVTLASGAPALEFPDRGVVVFSRKGSTVHAVTADSSEKTVALLNKLALTGDAVKFVPTKPHPMSMDFFDLRPLSLYFPVLNVWGLEKWPACYSKKALDTVPDYWGKFGFGHSYFDPYFGKDELANGAPQFFPLDNMIGKAKSRGAIVMAHMGMFWNPWWMRLAYPKDAVGWDPYAISGWGPLEAMSGPFLSQFASDDAYAYARRFTRDALLDLKANAGDNLGCYRVTGGGHPGDELNFHHMSTEYMDYDEPSRGEFRRWLREDRGLDLKTLGERWYGDANRFKNWDEVAIPSHFEFFGGFGGGGTFDLLQGWLWRPHQEKALAEGWGSESYTPGDEWTPVDLAPSMKQLFLFGSSQDKELRDGASKVSWFRKEFDPTAWLEKNKGAQCNVVAQVGDTQTDPVEVYLNGSFLGLIRPKTVWCGPIAFQATSLLKPGKNVLCLKVKNGLIRGPVFLTTQEPKRYPYLGVLGNARWLDLRDWNAHKLIGGWMREGAYSREVLPDIPMLFCSTDKTLMSEFLSAKKGTGLNSLHFTGGGSSFQPWSSGLGYLIGAYGTSEEGGTIEDPEALTRELAWMLLGTQGHHNYYHNATDCMKINEKTGWFSKHTRLFEIYGKSNWVKPPVAILRASRSDRYFPYSALADDWDIGRSSLQAAHIMNVYATETEVEEGLCDSYPILWDGGTSVFDDKLAAAIERYMRGGGTFVAVNVTGRHSPLEPDAWPISKLTGFKVLGERENMHITIVPDNPLLTKLSGMTFNGNGVAINWMGVNHLSEGAVALEPADGDGVVIARWEDGSVAVGMRKLGKGRVIVLGSSFWRSMSDRAGKGVSLNGSIQTNFFNDLFAGLGVKKQADIQSEDVWLRRMATKNGLQEWFMAYNAGRGEAKGQALSFPCERKPPRVVDVITGQNVTFEWQDGVTRILGIDIPANEMRVYGVDSAHLAGAFAHWLDEKRHYESRPALPAKSSQEKPAPAPSALTFDTFRFRQADASVKDSTSWLSEPVDTDAWKDVSYGFWDEMGFSEKGVGLYRCSFTPKPEWKGRAIILSFASFDYPVFLDKATVFINGQKAAEYKAHGWANFETHDVTKFAIEGRNELAILVEASEVRGAYIGQLSMYALEALRTPIALDGTWKVFSDNKKHVEAQMPINIDCRHIETTVTIPADWKNDQVVMEFEVENNWVGTIVVNDRAFVRNPYNHPYPNIMQANLYPYIIPGQPNKIELWPREPEGTARVKVIVKKVRIGTITPKN